MGKKLFGRTRKQETSKKNRNWPRYWSEDDTSDKFEEMGRS